MWLRLLLGWDLICWLHWSTAKKDPTCEYVFLRILIPLIPNLVTVWRSRTPFWSAPLHIAPLWRGYSFQNWGCSYNHHSVQSFARGYHDEFPWLAPTGWDSEIRKKRMMIYQICILEIKSKLNIIIMIIFMLGYPFLTPCFNLSIPTRVRL